MVKTSSDPCTMDRVKKIRPPAARHCTFVFGPPKTQTQPPKPPRPSLQLLLGLRLIFRCQRRIRFNELSQPQNFPRQQQVDRRPASSEIRHGTLHSQPPLLVAISEATIPVNHTQWNCD